MNDLVFCEICGDVVEGRIFWTDDEGHRNRLLVCAACARDIETREIKKVLVPNVSSRTLLFVGGVSVAATILNTTWPIMDVITTITALGSGSLLLLQWIGKSRR